MHIRDPNDKAKVEALRSNKKKTKAYKPLKGQGSGGWGWFFIKIVLFLVIVVGVYVGFTVYRTNKRSSRF